MIGSPMLVDLVITLLMKNAFAFILIFLPITMRLELEEGQGGLSVALPEQRELNPDWELN